MSLIEKELINARRERDEARTEAAALRRERDLARDTMTRAGWEYIPDAIGGPVWKPPVNVRMAELRRERDELSRRNAKLAARLAEIEQAAPERAEPAQCAMRLTDEQIVELRKTTRSLPGQWGDTKAFARAIEYASLKANGILEGGAQSQAAPADGCGACGDACRSRGSCRLAEESPEAAR